MKWDPASELDACDVIADAAASGTPLAVAGGDTKAAIGRPSQTERTLTSRGLAGITLHEPAELIVSARAGTPLAEVERALAAAGQHLPFEPADLRALLGSGGEPTIGAVAAANNSGPRRIQAGAARDSLVGVRFVNGRGEAIKSGGRVMKNVTGLDLVKLLAGSWGTLGFLTEVTFKVLPRPERAATLVLRGLDEPAAASAMSAALGSPFDVTGAAHVPPELGGFGAQTLIRLESFDPSVAYRIGELRRLFRPTECDVLDDETGAATWRAIRDVTAFAGTDEAVWRISTAPTRGHLFTALVSRELPARWFYDWGGGLVWLATPATGDAGAAAIRTALTGPGGHATLIRAPAAIRAAVPVFQPQADALRRLSAGIRASLDPAGIFNPGRMHAGV